MEVPSSSSVTGQGSNASSSEVTYVQDEPVIFLNPPVAAPSVVDAPSVKRVSRPRKRWLEEC